MKGITERTLIGLTQEYAEAHVFLKACSHSKRRKPSQPVESRDPLEWLTRASDLSCIHVLSELS